MTDFESSTGASREVNVEGTQLMIDYYRAGANGVHDIHTFTVEGQVQRAVTTVPGEPMSREEMDHSLIGYGAGGAEVPATYEGVMSVEACKELADHLEAKIAGL